MNTMSSSGSFENSELRREREWRIHVDTKVTCPNVCCYSSALRHQNFKSYSMTGPRTWEHQANSLRVRTLPCLTSDLYADRTDNKSYVHTQMSNLATYFWLDIAQHKTGSWRLRRFGKALGIRNLKDGRLGFPLRPAKSLSHGTKWMVKGESFFVILFKGWHVMFRSG